MKTQFAMSFRGVPTYSTLTRNRVAYLLRAAKSRKRNNILRHCDGSYGIVDCCASIFTLNP